MRLRKQDSNGDFTFGKGIENYWVDVPEGVGQLISTRLGLWQGEFFLDTTDGTPWLNGILGDRSNASYNLLLRSRIAGTFGVTQIQYFKSDANPITRNANFSAVVYTSYSKQPLIIGN